LDDVRAALGAAWTASPASLNTNTEKMTTCYYQNGMGNIVAFSMVYPPKGDAKTELAKRQKNVAVKHPVVAIPDLCEGAMTESLTARTPPSSRRRARGWCRSRSWSRRSRMSRLRRSLRRGFVRG